MNADIKNFLDSYNRMIETYRPKVEAGNAKLKAAEDYIHEMAAAAEKCSDISQYMGLVSEKGMMQKMTALLTDLATAALKADQAQAPGQRKLPSVADAAKGYHAAYDAIQEKEKSPGTVRIYERVFAIEKECTTAGEFVSKMAREQLFIKMASVPLEEKFVPQIKYAEDLSIPVMACHNEFMADMARKAGSAIEIEYESQRLLELNRMELMCDQMLANDLYYTLGNAVSSWMLNPSEKNRQSVENAYRFVSEFFGVDAEELHAIPRVVDLIKKVLLPALNKEGPRYTLESFIAEQKKAIEACMKGRAAIVKGSPSRKFVRLWGKSIPLSEALSAFRHPPRPPELSA